MYQQIKHRHVPFTTSHCEEIVNHGPFIKFKLHMAATLQVVQILLLSSTLYSCTKINDNLFFGEMLWIRPSASATLYKTLLNKRRRNEPYNLIPTLNSSLYGKHRFSIEIHSNTASHLHDGLTAEQNEYSYQYCIALETCKVHYDKLFSTDFEVWASFH